MLGKATVGLIFFLLVWGNLVAGLKAGLACPDWPLCHGKVLPPFRLDIYMEFLHRVIAAVAGASLIALSWQRFRAYAGRAKAVPVLAVGLLLAEVVMGGAVVLLKIPVQLTTVHFAAGLVIFLLAYYMMACDGVSSRPVFRAKGYPALFLCVGALVFLLAALGAYVRHAEAGLVCATWPLCDGSLLPLSVTGPTLIHFSHRVLAFLVFLTVVALYAMTALDPRLAGSRRLAQGLLVTIVFQVLVGGAVVLTKLYFLATAVHLAVALGMLSMLLGMWIREVREGEAA